MDVVLYIEVIEVVGCSYSILNSQVCAPRPSRKACIQVTRRDAPVTRIEVTYREPRRQFKIRRRG